MKIDEWITKLQHLSENSCSFITSWDIWFHKYVCICEVAFRDPGTDQEVIEKSFIHSDFKNPGDHRAEVQSPVSKRIVRKSKIRTRETQATVHTGLG